MMCQIQHFFSISSSGTLNGDWTRRAVRPNQHVGPFTRLFRQKTSGRPRNFRTPQQSQPRQRLSNQPYLAQRIPGFFNGSSKTFSLTDFEPIRNSPVGVYDDNLLSSREFNIGALSPEDANCNIREISAELLLYAVLIRKPSPWTMKYKYINIYI